MNLKDKASFVKKDKGGFTPLLTAACGLGQLDYIEVYNAKKKLYGEKLGEGEQMSALHFACRARDRNLVRQLLRRGADVNELVPESCPIWPGYTPLQLCIELKFEDVALMFCRYADLSIVSPNGTTLIFMADKKRLLELTPAMLRMYKPCIGNPVDKESGQSYLHLACKYGLVNVVEAFLHHGADVNLQNSSSGCTPLHMAKDASVVKVLLSYGANLCIKDRTDHTPLHKAFYQKNNEALQAMFDGHGQCRENPVSITGFTHFHIACMRGSEAAVKDILDHSVVDINALTHCGASPLVLASYYTDNTSVAQVLLDAGAKVNLKGGPPLNLTPLHQAVRFSRPNHVALLLKRGADCNGIGTEQLWSPLHEACVDLHDEIVKLLLEHGADPNAKQEGTQLQMTPLHVFGIGERDSNWTDGRYDHVIRRFVEFGGVDLDARGNCGFTPTAFASCKENECPLRALLFYCPNTDENRTVELIVIRIRRGHSIKVLLEHLEMLRHTNPSNVTSDDSDLLERIHKSGLHSEDEVTSIRHACRKEIEVLREMGLHTCLTYSNIFTKNAIGVGRLWQRSAKLVELVESNELHRFPVYGDRLRRWYDDLQRVPSCLERALVVVKKHWNLDQDSVETIFRYLNSKELETMVKAFEFS